MRIVEMRFPAEARVAFESESHELPTMFHNPTRRRARYAVVIASEPRGRR